ncbi:MAG: hypothetical protein NTV33_13500 [Coprothermobacterota bacterium]|nr:hypothetical protein [Coprothermobacterota bacterium]
MKQYKIKHLFNDSDGSDGYTPQVWSGQTEEKDPIAIHYKYGELKVFIGSVLVLATEPSIHLPGVTSRKISSGALYKLLEDSGLFVDLNLLESTLLPPTQND